MMKKILVIVMVLVMVVSLCACGGGGTPEADGADAALGVTVAGTDGAETIILAVPPRAESE